jgi:hypothetical protein
MALTGTGLIVVAPLAPVTPPPAPHLAALGIHLTAGGGDLGLQDLLNIPINLFNDMFNIPYVLFSAPYSVEGMIPNFPVDDQHVPGSGDLPAGETPGTAFDQYHGVSEWAWPLYNGPYDLDNDPGTFTGALNFLAGSLDYTGSWYESVPTNVWGWDTANTWNFPALIDVLTPWGHLGESMEANPIADNLNQLLEAEFPIAEPANKFFFHDLLGEVQNLFKVPLADLTGDNGYPLPESLNPVGSEPDPLGEGGYTYHEIWDGTTAHVDPSFGFAQILEHLTQDPADNPIQLPNLEDLYPALVHIYNASNVDFSPFDPGTDSFLFQAPLYVYGLPAIINGIVNGEHGLDPGAPDVIPASVWQPLGEALDSAFGPDTAFAHFVSDLTGRVQDLAEGSLNIFLPASDSLHETPSQVLSQVFSPGYVNASQTEIQQVLNDYAANHPDVSFGGGHDSDNSFESNLALVLAGNPNTEILSGHVSADDVSAAIAHSGLDNYPYEDVTNFDAGDIADALNGADASGFLGDFFGGIF